MTVRTLNGNNSVVLTTEQSSFGSFSNLRGGVGEKRGLCIHEVLSLASGLSGFINTSSGMLMMSPTENGVPTASPGTGLSRGPKEPIRAPLPITWEVPGTDTAASGEGASLLGFLSAMSASTLKGRMATLGFSSAELRLVCASPRLTTTDRGGASSVFKPAIKADMVTDGAIQVRQRHGPAVWLWNWECRGSARLGARTNERVERSCLMRGSSISSAASSCLCDQKWSSGSALIRQAWRGRRPIRDGHGRVLGRERGSE